MDSTKTTSLSGWLGKKRGSPQDELPSLNVAAGVNRALRKSQSAPKQTPVDEHLNPAREALSAIEAALFAIDRVRDILEQACEVALSAREVEDAGGRALLAESYDELRLSIDDALEKIDPAAALLLGKDQRNLDVSLGGRARYSVSSMRLDIGENGLNLAPPREAFSTDSEIDLVLDRLDQALSFADRAASGYCRDAQYLIARMKSVMAQAV